ncbi:DUF6212 domain-containing protein [Temperatibacter marinus]|uniref:DUF6212 domain-containing protein n=1 Tax=Temperatibacter marinus TaxID=1456591 RepID=A0AA52EEF2_9PROT|nr:DUF6212 domain-containing protein [Temperatibacter marinus]WND03195.1 DUF6212 domain-containing protein [Temperatibacter marinus]
MIAITNETLSRFYEEPLLIIVSSDAPASLIECLTQIGSVLFFDGRLNLGHQETDQTESMINLLDAYPVAHLIFILKEEHRSILTEFQSAKEINRCNNIIDDFPLEQQSAEQLLTCLSASIITSLSSRSANAEKQITALRLENDIQQQDLTFLRSKLIEQDRSSFSLKYSRAVSGNSLELNEKQPTYTESIPASLYQIAVIDLYISSVKTKQGNLQIKVIRNADETEMAMISLKAEEIAQGWLHLPIENPSFLISDFTIHIEQTDGLEIAFSRGSMQSIEAAVPQKPLAIKVWQYHGKSYDFDDFLRYFHLSTKRFKEYELRTKTSYGDALPALVESLGYGPVGWSFDGSMLLHSLPDHNCSANAYIEKTCPEGAYRVETHFRLKGDDLENFRLVSVVFDGDSDLLPEALSAIESQIVQQSKQEGWMTSEKYSCVWAGLGATTSSVSNVKVDCPPEILHNSKTLAWMLVPLKKGRGRVTAILESFNVQI